MYILAPSVYAADYMELRQQLRTMEKAGISRLHVDVMDGHFVPNLSFGADFVQALRQATRMELDVHLMVSNPERHIGVFAAAGADIITVHLEAGSCLEKLLDEIHAQGRRAGIVLKPESALAELSGRLWSQTDVLQLMTVQPGEKGQSFQPAMLEKIARAKAMIRESGRRIELEVDGDINELNLKDVLHAGANVIVMGKALFGGGLEENLRKYQRMQETADELAGKASGEEMSIRSGSSPEQRKEKAAS